MKLEAEAHWAGQLDDNWTIRSKIRSVIRSVIRSEIQSEVRPDKKQMIKDAKGKKGGKTIFIIHYFEENDQYRIESPPVITGGLKNSISHDVV